MADDGKKRYADRKAITERWESTRLLSGIKSEFEREQMAVMLQNQVEDNEANGEHRTECHDPEARGKYVPFLRMSVPIVRRVFNSNSLLVFKLGSVQAIQAVEDVYHYRDPYGVLKPRSVGARVRRFKEAVQPIEAYLDKDAEGNPIRSAIKLDEEAEMCLKLSERFADEINTEVVWDIKTNAAVKNVYEWRSPDVLRSSVGLVAGQVFRRTNRNPTWILTSAEMASELLGERKVLDGRKPSYAGTWNEKYRVYTYYRMEQNEILLGHRGDDYSAGYFYCPMTPVFWMPDGKDPSKQEEYRYMTRYGKAMPFPDFFGHMTVTGYQPTEAKETDVRDNLQVPEGDSAGDVLGGDGDQDGQGR